MMSSDDRYMLLKGYMGTCTVYGYMYSVWVHVQHEPSLSTFVRSGIPLCGTADVAAKGTLLHHLYTSPHLTTSSKPPRQVKHVPTHHLDPMVYERERKGKGKGREGKGKGKSR